MFEYQFKALYFDGKTSLGSEAIIEFLPMHWSVKYTNVEGESKTLLWQINAIEQEQFVSNKLVFKYGVAPSQLVEVYETELFTSVIKQTYSSSKNFSNPYDKLFSRGFRGVLGLLAFFIGTIVLIYFFVLPPTASFLAGNLPRQYEDKLGEYVYQGMDGSITIDDTLTPLVNDFIKEINFETDYPIKAVVVSNDELNAFALPGGRIIIYDALLYKMTKPEQLAALLGHEVAHIKNRHSIKSLSRNISGYIFFSLLFNDINGMTTVFLENAEKLNTLRYSRDLETEADEESIQTLEKNHIDATGIVELFKILKSGGDDKLHIPQILSTHPLTDDRIIRAKKAVKEQGSIHENQKIKDIWNKIQHYQ